MKFWPKHKWKIIVPVLIVLALAAAFTFGDRDMPKQKDTSEQPTVAAPVETPEQDTAAADVPDDVETGPVETPAESTPEPSDDPQTGESAQANTEQPEYVSPEEVQASASGEYEEVGGMLIDTGTGKDKYQTDPVPEGKPIPVEPEDVEIGDAEYTCTLSISCATILDNMELCNKEKRELVPEDGWLLKPVEVTFQEGQSVFDVLQQVCRENKLHLEFSTTPVYGSAYIEGIGNLYEFDCGAESGWMYAVNGWFPNYGCSQYALQDGDTVTWVYTCELGRDVGSGGWTEGE